LFATPRFLRARALGQKIQARRWAWDFEVSLVFRFYHKLSTFGLKTDALPPRLGLVTQRHFGEKPSSMN